MIPSSPPQRLMWCERTKCVLWVNSRRTQTFVMSATPSPPDNCIPYATTFHDFMFNVYNYKQVSLRKSKTFGFDTFDNLCVFNSDKVMFAGHLQASEYYANLHLDRFDTFCTDNCFSTNSWQQSYFQHRQLTLIVFSPMTKWCWLFTSPSPLSQRSTAGKERTDFLWLINRLTKEKGSKNCKIR